MKPIAGICLFGTFCLTTLSQTTPIPKRWTGRWILNIQKSTFGAILFPGVPVGLKIVGQTIRIEQIAMDIRLSGDTVMLDSSGAHAAHDDNRLRLDGTPAIIGPGALSFRRVDDSTFEIISTVNIPNRNLGEVSRFVFSSDGGELIETKTQSEREVVPKGTDRSAGVLIKTSKFLLVFAKTPSP